MSARAPIDRPWNEPSSARIRGRSVPPLRRASLNAASLASVPELVRKTRDPSGAPARASSRSANAICVGLPKKLETCPSVPSCALIAAVSVGCA